MHDCFNGFRDYLEDFKEKLGSVYRMSIRDCRRSMSRNVGFAPPPDSLSLGYLFVLVYYLADSSVGGYPRLHCRLEVHPLCLPESRGSP